MINPDKRKAIALLHDEGVSIRAISRQLSIRRKTIREIINQKGAIPQRIRKDKKEIDEELLRRLYTECNGYIQRIHEKLTEEEHISIGYSTLTKLLRDLEIGQTKNQRCSQIEEEPGVEMQHDTSPYKVKLGNGNANVVASIVYYRYSKVRYLKFYRFFNRFNMKCFLHEGFTFFEYCAPTCIIDNTNLARLRGTGKNAIIVDEMGMFGKQYGFEFICHAVGHSNRKAGNERSFYTVETNFFPGRTFSSLEDMNRQALEWATVTFAQRPLSKVGTIPASLFEHEKSFLKKLPSFVQPPYLVHERTLDQYGYASFSGNYYWVPGTKRHDVTLLQYSDCIKIYYKRELKGVYELPPDGIKNEKVAPKGGPKPTNQPKYRKKPTTEEEKRLRAISNDVDMYLNFVIKEKGASNLRRDST